MEQFSHESEQESLMNEPVTEAELKQILEHISETEFGGPPQTTVRDIIEATSADHEHIRSILAQIRSERSPKDTSQIHPQESTPTVPVPNTVHSEPVLIRYPVIFIQGPSTTVRRLNGASIQEMLRIGSFAVVAFCILLAVALPSCDRNRTLDPPVYDPEPASVKATLDQPRPAPMSRVLSQPSRTAAKPKPRSHGTR